MTDYNPKEFISTLPNKPGVYQMIDASDVVIYVGKAANLKKRVSSYFGRTHDSPKTRALVKQIARIEIVITHTEGEALLLESNLIKELKPRYNIVFRDDKSYPYLYLSTEHEFPRLSFYRGKRKGKGRYFGPYPSAGAARQTLNLVQKLFQVRQCDDSFYRNRSRPCLQYQIKRCTAPCVEYIDQHRYAESVQHTIMFLEGKNEDVIDILTKPMEKAANALEYERAAQYRDQIIKLRRILESQHIVAPKGEIDVIACTIRADMACVQVFFIRGGRNLGNKVFFPTHTKGANHSDVISSFLTQYYLGKNTERHMPDQIYLSHEPEDMKILEQGLSQQTGKPLKLQFRFRGEQAQWVRMAEDNAVAALNQRISMKQSLQDRFNALSELLKLDESVERIECFDISHTRGEATVASCVVFGTEGAIKSDYRHFNIEDIQAGDDYAAMRQVIERRYIRVQKEEGKLPDLILIDGGKGQVGSAREVMMELQLGDIPMLGIAKGPDRKPGMETLILSDTKETIRLPANSSALHLIQEIRDEAHRFAITGHRQRRRKVRNQSPLEQIEGIGSKRRQRLIKHFGGLQGVERAGRDELAKVPGINKNLADRIYDTLHES